MIVSEETYSSPQKYEYHVFEYRNGQIPSGNNKEEVLGKVNAEGWEVLQIAPESFSNSVLILAKRKI